MKTKKPKQYDIRCTLYTIWVACLIIAAAGCESDNSTTKQINTLREEGKQLTRQIEQSESQNKQLKKQLQTLAGLPDDVRLENLYNLQTVKVGRYTNFYDKDKDGQKEKLIVYIQPTDEQGDIVKATGNVDIQLWDLNKDNGQALLSQWQVKPDELKELWFASIVSVNYRLTFDIADKITEFEEPLTVKVTFTDYLAGKVFKEQRVIKP